MIDVEYKGNLKILVGKTHESFCVGTIEELLRAIKKEYCKEIYTEIKRSHVMINGTFAQKKFFKKCQLKENDYVVFFSVCCGG